jgi:hypothetical protein
MSLIFILLAALLHLVICLSKYCSSTVYTTVNDRQELTAYYIVRSG